MGWKRPQFDSNFEGGGRRYSQRNGIKVGLFPPIAADVFLLRPLLDHICLPAFHNLQTVRQLGRCGQANFWVNMPTAIRPGLAPVAAPCSCGKGDKNVGG
jgi:hypothetical protein